MKNVAIQPIHFFEKENIVTRNISNPPMTIIPPAAPPGMNESWTWVQNVHPNLMYHRYIVSNLGRIYDMYKKRLLNPIVAKYNSNKSYQTVSLVIYETPYSLTRIAPFVHRVVMLSFMYKPGCENLEVNHRDFNRQNNCIWNLEWCTSQENIAYSRLSGNYGKMARETIKNEPNLSKQQVLAICEARMHTTDIDLIGEMFNLSPDYIHKILHRGVYTSWTKDYIGKFPKKREINESNISSVYSVAEQKMLEDRKKYIKSKPIVPIVKMQPMNLDGARSPIQKLPKLYPSEKLVPLFYPDQPNIMKNRYMVSSLGKVYDCYLERYITITYDNRGYKMVNLPVIQNDGSYKHMKIQLHRLVLSSFNPREDQWEYDVNHIDSNRLNDNLNNLEWATEKENVDDYLLKGRDMLISKVERFKPELAQKVLDLVKQTNDPEFVAVKLNVNTRLVHALLDGDIYPEIREKYNLPNYFNHFKKSRENADVLDEDTVKNIKKDIIDGMKEADIMRKYDKPRHVISDIRHKRSYTNIGDEVPDTDNAVYLDRIVANDIGKLLADGKSLKEVCEISGYTEHTVIDIKRGLKYPEVKEKYNLNDVAIYNEMLDDDIIVKAVIPEMLTKTYHSDKEVAGVFGCSSAQIRDLRLHRRRKYLTEGIDFNNCYIPSERKRTHCMKPSEIIEICEFIQANPKMPYDGIVKALTEKIPNITYKICQDLKLRKNHNDITSKYVW